MSAGRREGTNEVRVRPGAEGRGATVGMSADRSQNTTEDRTEDVPTDRGRLIVRAGPTAVGKGTIAAYVRTHFPDVFFSVSMTTRRPRPDEVDGVQYHFVDEGEFDRLVEAGQFLEHAVVHGLAKYGTPRGPAGRAPAEGRDALLELDLQGARQVRATMPDAFFVFLDPPSWEELVRRLVDRGTEDQAERERRLDTARRELAAKPEFDAVIVNDDVRRASEELVSLMRSGRANR